MEVRDMVGASGYADDNVSRGCWGGGGHGWGGGGPEI